MLQLLSSFWFIALAGLLVPVLIHFWNKKQPQVIKVGTIRWLVAAASKKASSLRFQDWPLLLLRCLLLAALVMFLVQPIWKEAIRPENKKYVWVAPELLQAQNLPLIQSTIDSLAQQHYELRQLTNTFPTITVEDWTNIKSGNLPVKERSDNINYWVVAQQLSRKFPATAEHLIFTPNYLVNYTGQRPILNTNIQWVIIPTTQKKVWVQEAFQVNADSLTILLGRSSHSGTSFTRYNFASPAPNQPLRIADAPEIVFSPEGEQTYVNIPATGGKIAVQTTPLRVAVFYDESRRTDAEYMRAALAALRSYTHRPLSINLTSNANEINPELNLLFWLSDSTLPDKLTPALAQGLFVFKDAPGMAKNTTVNWLTVAGLPEPILLNQQASIFGENKLHIWQNNYGESILHFIPEEKGGTYYFASRFNTEWNSLPESGYFPEILGSLLWPEPTVKQDARIMAASQPIPLLSPAMARQKTETMHLQDLKYWFLLLAIILFLIERIWVSQKAKIST